MKKYIAQRIKILSVFASLMTFINCAEGNSKTDTDNEKREVAQDAEEIKLSQPIINRSFRALKEKYDEMRDSDNVSIDQLNRNESRKQVYLKNTLKSLYKHGGARILKYMNDREIYIVLESSDFLLNRVELNGSYDVGGNPKHTGIAYVRTADTANRSGEVLAKVLKTSKANIEFIESQGLAYKFNNVFGSRDGPGDEIGNGTGVISPYTNSEKLAKP